MAIDISKLASMTPDEGLDAVLGHLRQMAALYATSIAGLMRDGESPRVIAEACARRRLARIPADLLGSLSTDEAMRRAAGLFSEQLWEALSQVSEYALEIFRAAQDLAGATPKPAPAKHAPNAREFAERLRYYADLLEQTGGYLEAAERVADHLAIEQELDGQDDSLWSRFDIQAKADGAGVALLTYCVRGVLGSRA